MPGLALTYVVEYNDGYRCWYNGTGSARVNSPPKSQPTQSTQSAQPLANVLLHTDGSSCMDTSWMDTRCTDSEAEPNSELRPEVAYLERTAEHLPPPLPPPYATDDEVTATRRLKMYT
jgi:hypothetical protein